MPAPLLTQARASGERLCCAATHKHIVSMGAPHWPHCQSWGLEKQSWGLENFPAEGTLQGSKWFFLQGPRH